MIILPTEKRFDWRHKPAMLFTIAFLNIAIFFVYQSDDTAKVEYAFAQYYDLGLLQNEWSGYQTYLEQQGDNESLDYYREQYDTDYHHEIIFSVIYDRDFYRYLKENGDNLSFDAYSSSDTWQNWYENRAKVNQTIASLSPLSFGLIPSELSVVTLITYQFLHGDIMHLLGNLFFLIFCGFAVEAAIGGWIFLALYLLSGIAGGLLFAVLDLSSQAPLVGASGSISGVMAMYLGIFRLRKIEFFYWILIFAGYFRAPALLILPLYIGKELTDFYLNTGSNVAFMAHAGGFGCGALLLGFIYKLRPQLINTDYVEEDQSIEPEREARAKIFAYVEQGAFAKAISSITHYNKEFGRDFELSTLALKLSLGVKDGNAQQHFASLVEIKTRKDADLDLLAKFAADNATLQQNLTPKQRLQLALKLTTSRHIDLAEDIFNALREGQPKELALDVLARKLAIVYEKEKRPEKAQHFKAFAEQTLGGAI